MKIIRICFVDFFPGFNETDNDFIDILNKRYEVIIDKKNPDAIFYSCFGKKHIDYNCIRIFFTGECVSPDFNVCDYAIGFDRLDFGDRYIRIPLYRLFQYKKLYDSLFDRKNIAYVSNDKDFCSFVCSNCFADDIRAKMYNVLSRYKKINSGGRYLNNIGGPVLDKLEFQKKHKFAIAFENSSYDGYVTEKLVDAFAAGVVPIYFGDPNIHFEFNEKAFINGHRFDTLEAIVERVKELDNNDTLYLSVLNSNPILLDKRGNKDLELFLYAIFDQAEEKARRRPHSRQSIEYESFVKRHRFFEEVFFSKFIRARKILYRLIHHAI